MQFAISVATRVSELCCSPSSEVGGGEFVSESDEARAGGREEILDEERRNTERVRRLGRERSSAENDGPETPEGEVRSSGEPPPMVEIITGETSRGQPLAMQDSIIMALVIARILDFSASRLDAFDGKASTDVANSSSGTELLEEESQSSGEMREIITGAEKLEPSQVEELQSSIPRPRTISEVGESSRRRGQALDSVRLVTSWFSPYAHRVAISLREKGVQYVGIEESVLNKNERTLNANPLSKRIPILMHRGKAISESRIIMEYIEEAWPESPTALLPKDPFERSAARYWSDYIDKKIAQIILQHISVNSKEVYETISDALRGLNKAMTVISHGKAFFMGDRLGFVDIMFAPMIPWFQVLQRLDNYRLPNAQECPRLHQWLNALQRHPSVRPSLEASSPRKLRAFVLQRFRQKRK